MVAALPSLFTELYGELCNVMLLTVLIKSFSSDAHPIYAITAKYIKIL